MNRSRLFGPVIDDSGVMFRLWAPGVQSVELIAGETTPMQRGDDGWFTLRRDAASERYAFRIDGDITVPDPASRFQPDDVNGSSALIRDDYVWQAADWKGRPWHETVLLELHVGAFTPDGTFRAAIDKLDHVVECGFTAIELMPVSEFPGRWNWGYDGVMPYAPDSAYGAPDDLKALIDAAHTRGLMVFLDVVYNHFGPEGNYLPRLAPSLFTDAHTPWGSAIDYRIPEVRAFVVENCLLWLDTYRFDGLRFDAVHAITERGDPPLLHAISTAAGDLARETGRHIHLVLENDDNEAALLDPRAEVPAGKFRAQWNDDYHHAWHVLLTSETAGYYADYEKAGDHLARILAEGFAYQGEPSGHRDNIARGQPSGDLPATAFMNFLQNHDQIGNRALGERIDALTTPEAVEAALVITLLGPAPPMMFMGEEWGAPEPFPFFCDFKGELADAVRAGRRKEFAAAYADPTEDVPDPLDEATLRKARLDWGKRDDAKHKRRLDHVRALLHVRHDTIVPVLPMLAAGRTSALFDNGLLEAKWETQDGGALKMVANLSDEQRFATEVAAKNWIWGGTPGEMLSPWSVHVALDRV